MGKAIALMFLSALCGWMTYLMVTVGLGLVIKDWGIIILAFIIQVIAGVIGDVIVKE